MNFKLDPSKPQPLHKQAEELLREIITREEYQKGKLLPNEVELSKQMNISRNTLRQAINKLVFEGLLVRKKGYGTIVAPKNVMSNARNWMSFTEEMRSQGIAVRNFELHVTFRQPPEEVSRFFETDESRLFCMERLRGNTSAPFVYFISYFNPAIGMTGEEDFTRPLYEMLKSVYGIQVQTSREMVYAREADKFIAEKLNISEGDPILVRKRFVLDSENMPVEYNIGYYKADSFIYSIEFSGIMVK